MHEPVEKTPEKKCQSAPNSLSQRKNSNAPTSRYADNRPESIQMRKFQALAMNGPQDAKIRVINDLAAAHSGEQKRSNNEYTFQFGYNWHEDVAQSKINKAYNSPRETQQQTKVHKTVRQAPVQLFKDTVAGQEITQEVITAAATAKLQEWLARDTVEAPEVPEKWDEAESDQLFPSDGSDLIPSTHDKELIHKEIQRRIEADNAEKLGVTVENLRFFRKINSDDNHIRQAADHCNTNEWDLSSILDQINNACDDAKRAAVSVLAKKEVTESSSVTDLANNWVQLQSRDDIPIDVLCSLIKNNAIISSGGEYKKEGAIDGSNKHYAYTFLTNGIQPIRLDPEWHYHQLTDGTSQKPGFKTRQHKHQIGDGTRRLINPDDQKKLLAAVHA